MYENRIGSIRKRIKIPIFSKNNYFSRYHGSFVINKIVNNIKMSFSQLRHKIEPFSRVKVGEKILQFQRILSK